MMGPDTLMTRLSQVVEMTIAFSPKNDIDTLPDRLVALQ